MHPAALPPPPLVKFFLQQLRWQRGWRRSQGQLLAGGPLVDLLAEASRMAATTITPLVLRPSEQQGPLWAAPSPSAVLSPRPAPPRHRSAPHCLPALLPLLLPRMCTPLFLFPHFFPLPRLFLKHPRPTYPLVDLLQLVAIVDRVLDGVPTYEAA